MHEHLNDHHGFEASSDLPDDFLRGLHHGLHVGEGRHGGETHLHEPADAGDDAGPNRGPSDAARAAEESPMRLSDDGDEPHFKTVVAYAGGHTQTRWWSEYPTEYVQRHRFFSDGGPPGNHQEPRTIKVTPVATAGR